MPVADVAVGRDPRSSRRATVHVPASQEQQLVRQNHALHNAPAMAIQVTTTQHLMANCWLEEIDNRQFVAKTLRHVPASFPRVGTNTRPTKATPISSIAPTRVAPKF